MNPFGPPKLRDDLPRYPVVTQLLRVTAATVPGPSGGASTGPGVGNVPPSVLYVSSTQQLRTDTLAPRDREPCLAVEASGAALTAGYYIGRLAGSYGGLPVYEVVASTGGGSTGPKGDKGDTGATGGAGPVGPAGSSGLLPGLTVQQLASVNASLTPLQITALNNLTACQLQVLMQLPMTNIQTLGASLTPTDLANVVDALPYTKLQQIVTTLPTHQILGAASADPLLYQALNQALTPAQVNTVLFNLSAQRVSTLAGLTPAQLGVVAGLTVPQLQALTNMTQTQVSAIVGQLTTSQLGSLLTSLTVGQLNKLTNNLSAVQIQQLVLALTVTQIATQLNNLTPAQLVALTLYQAATIAVMVTTLTAANLIVVLNAAVVLQVGPVSQWYKYNIAKSGANWRVTAPDGTTTDTALAASNSQTVVAATPPAGATITAANLGITSALTGLTTPAMSVGYSGGDTTGGGSASSLVAFVGSTTVSTTRPRGNFGFPTGADPCPHKTSSWNLTFNFTAGNNMTNLTGGSLDVWVQMGLTQ